MARLWLLVGAGRCGLHLHRAMQASGVATAGVVVRSARSRARVASLGREVAIWRLGRKLPAADALLVAVPDDALGACAERLAASPGLLPVLALHTSGALPAEVLAPLRARGCRLGSFHPLFSFPPADAAPVDLAGALAAVEGDDEAVAAAAELAATLAMAACRIDAAAKPRYHAAAALAANLAPALIALARNEMVAAGLPPAAARAGLAALVPGAIAAALENDDWEWLTGPAARGDSTTVASHLEALAPDVAAAYAAVTRVVVDRIGRAGNLESAAVRRLLAALTAHGLCASFQTMPRTEDR